MTASGAMIHSAYALQSKQFRMVGVVAFRGRRFRGLRSLSPDYRWNRREEHGRSQILFRLADLSRRSDRYSLLAHRRVPHTPPLRVGVLNLSWGERNFSLTIAPNRG